MIRSVPQGRSFGSKENINKFKSWKDDLKSLKSIPIANTYSQINIHSIFAVKGRENFITKNFRDDLHKYMSGILRNDGSYPLAVGGWKDHVHVFFELQVTMPVSKQMQMLKATSSKWVNDHHFVTGRFQWQEGYAALSLPVHTETG